MSSIFSGKTILVTGSSRGIGKAVAQAFANEGAQVVLAARDVKALARSLNEVGGMAVPCDVGDPVSVRNLFQQIDDEFGPVDILINNAAIGYSRDFLDVTPAEFDQMMRINVGGVFFCSQEMMRRIRQRGHGGQIVNLSSLGGVQGTEKFKGLSTYVASKAAVVGLTEALAVEGREWNIRVNCVAPGAVDTDMLREAAPHLRTETLPEDVARVILDLCREADTQGTTGKIVEIHSNIT